MQQTYATQLANEAQKSGLEKTAQAHHLQAVTTDFLEQSAVVPGLADGSKMLAQAFTAKPKSPPQVTTTGEGFGVFQVLDVKAAHAPVFEEYKAKLLEDYRDQILPQMLATKTNAMAEMAHNGNDLEKAAKQFGAVVKTQRSRRLGRAGSGSWATLFLSASIVQIAGKLDQQRFQYRPYRFCGEDSRA